MLDKWQFGMYYIHMEKTMREIIIRILLIVIVLGGAILVTSQQSEVATTEKLGVDSTQMKIEMLGTYKTQHLKLLKKQNGFLERIAISLELLAERDRLRTKGW